MLIIPPLLARVRECAPGIDLAIVPAGGAQLAQQLETGDVDFAVVPRIDRSDEARPEPPAQGLLQKTLFRDRFACLLRAGHPALDDQGRLSLKRYLAASHALMSPRGDGLGQVDEALAKRGLSRRIVLRLPNFFAARAIVARSDLVLTAPTVLAALGDDGGPVVAAPPPLPLPEHSVNLLWHERFDNDPAHRWLRELLSQVALEVATKLDIRPARAKRRL